jgi:hypothetical protein
MDVWRLRLLYHSTQRAVASSSCSNRQGLCLRMTSVLQRPMTDSARALSYESPREPTEQTAPGVDEPLGVANGEVLDAPVGVMDQTLEVGTSS